MCGVCKEPLLAWSACYGCVILSCPAYASTGSHRMNFPLVLIDVAKVIGMVGKDRYGKQRLWASISWGVCATLTGVVSDRLGLFCIFIIYPCASGVFVTLLMYYFCRVTIFTNFSIRAIWFPVEILKKENKNEHMVRSMLVVLKNGEMIMILVASFITAAALATTSFVFIYLKQTFGVEKQILGLYGMSVACSVVLEVPIFFFAKQLSARFVLAFSLMKETDSAMTVCYWFLMGVILFAHSPGALFQILGFYFLLSLFTDLFSPLRGQQW